MILPLLLLSLASEKEQLFRDPRDWQVIAQMQLVSCRRILEQTRQQI
uniref:Uncharacterized protein n=1 Tax=Arundo donax TaxID=35708 RepID=A0A0A9CPZ0_ARUDO